MAAKRRSKTISLKGDAARAFIGMYTQRPAQSEDEVLARLATLVHMNVANGDIPKAVELIRAALAK